MKVILKAVMLSAVLALTACTNVFMNNSQKTPAFSEVEYSHLKGLPNYDVSQVRLLEVAQHKDQVRQILGNPHFNEGIFSPKVWNYALGLKLSANNDYQNCRLRIDFDRNNRVEKLTWKDQVCADFVNGNI
ncbi:MULTISPECIES: outer membrane protein assembly factor BamE [Psychrobacter]|uniref:outer membrane protein assembly factor BamE n=1 Tax=Psychrobacter TaxID=497 RepID=UPI0019193ADE|nr:MULTISPECIES: outer membrane protein assembly factor BamE [Psychrobacter]